MDRDMGVRHREAVNPKRAPKQMKKVLQEATDF